MSSLSTCVFAKEDKPQFEEYTQAYKELSTKERNQIRKPFPIEYEKNVFVMSV